MSLILDALEQAEHERRRQQATEPGQARLGMAAAAIGGATSSDRKSNRSPGWLLWLVLGAALALTGVLAWERWDAATPPPLAQTTQPDLARLPALPGAAPTQPAAALFTPPPPAPARAQPGPPTGAPTVASGSAAAAATPAASAPTTAQASTPATKPIPTPVPPPAAQPAATTAAVMPAALGPATPPAEQPVSAPVPLASELPAQTRARLPSITITGHTYSDNPTLRTLMVDGRMLVEGQTLAPGLRLERIERHQAVFNQGGTRFGVGY